MALRVGKTKNTSKRLSRIHIRQMSSTPVLFKMNYDNWKEDGSPEVDLLIGSKYVVHADISKCYPSVYSHSLPWAIAGKEYKSISFTIILKCSLTYSSNIEISV